MWRLLFLIGFVWAVPSDIDKHDPFGLVSFDDVGKANIECRNVEDQRVEYDERCTLYNEELGCGAGGQQRNCRFCGFSIYPACPGPGEDNEEDQDVTNRTVTIVEGDIMVPNKTAAEYYKSFEARNEQLLQLLKAQADQNSEVFQTAIRSTTHLWRNGIVPFVISTRYSARERSNILSAMAKLERYSCIRFVQRTSHTDYIYLKRGAGCYALVGRWGRKQTVVLGHGCLSKGTVMHELMHVLGFLHEHSRADRDEHVRIVWKNIAAGAKPNFKKYTLKEIDHLGQKYDYASIMHYTATAWSKRGRKTIIPKKSGVVLLHSSRKNWPSQTDYDKINILYNCGSKPRVPRQRLVTDRPIRRKTKPPKKPPVRRDGCRDLNRNCKAWKKAKLCNFNSLFMHHACALSCNRCQFFTRNCVDKDNACRGYARKRKCRSQPEYMKSVCPKSCGYCRGG